MTSKKGYRPTLNAQVVQEILREDKPVTQIASEHGIHPTVLREWKVLVLRELPTLFERQTSVATLKADYERQMEDLYAEIGRLTTQFTWLKKPSGQTSRPRPQRRPARLQIHTRVGSGFEHEPFLDRVLVLLQALDGLVQLVHLNVREKAEPPDVDAEEGGIVGARLVCGAEERAISTKRQDEVTFLRNVVHSSVADEPIGTVVVFEQARRNRVVDPEVEVVLPKPVDGLRHGGPDGRLRRVARKAVDHWRGVEPSELGAVREEWGRQK